jgi:hypothetical protein
MDVTAAKTGTDAKMGGGGQGIHLLYTDQGNFRVEAPVAKGRSFALALAQGMENANRPYWAQQAAPIVHNKWFLDNVQPGMKVLFASECDPPKKKHPNDTVRCVFYFPDPDSTDHEYETIGDFTPYLAGDGSNLQRTANVLCGTGKLRAEVEQQLCGVTGTTASNGTPANTSAFKSAALDMSRSTVSNGTLSFKLENCGRDIPDSSTTMPTNDFGVASGKLQENGTFGCSGTDYYTVTLKDHNSHLVWTRPYQFTSPTSDLSTPLAALPTATPGK